MTWFFAALVVLVLGAVAVVAAGRGGSMVEVFDDRPDARVQADGPLTAEDLRGVRFTTAFRGYRMSEVDTLLDRLAAELEAPVGSERDTRPSWDPHGTDHEGSAAPGTVDRDRARAQGATAAPGSPSPRPDAAGGASSPGPGS